MTLLAAFILGLCAGMRSMTAPAAVAWAAWAGRLDLGDAWYAFMASPWAVGVFTLLAAGELVADKLPMTPSRLKPGPLIGRLLSGGFSGLCVGGVAGLTLGALGGGVGAAVFWWVRDRLAKKFGKDLPAALLEDALAVGGVTFACGLLL